jgi:hypothetical protein
LWAPPPEFKSEPEAAPFYDPYYDEDETVEVDELERKLMGLRQMIGRSGGGTVLNMHDKDDLFHFSIEGFLQHPEEKSDARPRKTE